MNGSGEVIRDAALIQPTRCNPARPWHNLRTPAASSGSLCGGSSRKYRYQQGRTNDACCCTHSTRADRVCPGRATVPSFAPTDSQ